MDCIFVGVWRGKFSFCHCTLLNGLPVMHITSWFLMCAQWCNCILSPFLLWRGVLDWQGILFRYPQKMAQNHSSPISLPKSDRTLWKFLVALPLTGYVILGILYQCWEHQFPHKCLESIEPHSVIVSIKMSCELPSLMAKIKKPPELESQLWQGTPQIASVSWLVFYTGSMGRAPFLLSRHSWRCRAVH